MDTSPSSDQPLVPTSCLWCKSTRLKLIRGFRSAKDEIQLGRCDSCGSELLMPQPSAEDLTREYDNYFTRRQETSINPKESYLRELLNLSTSLTAGVRVLDLGSGEGFLVRTANQWFPGLEVSAVEPLWISAPPASDLRGTLIASSIEDWLGDSSTQKYDIIFALDFLEHVRNPAEIVKHIVGKLADGGILVATFPRADSLSHALMGKHWFQYKLEHISYPASRGVQLLSEEVGLKNIKIEKLKKCYPIDYFLNVGSNFGPPSFQRVGRIARALIPRSFARIPVTIPCGELLWIASKSA